MTRRWSLPFVLGVAAVGPLSLTPGLARSTETGPPKSLPSCSQLARARVVYRSRSGDVTVYRRRVRGDGGPHDWACPRAGSAAASPLGTVPGGGFARGVTVRDFLSSGPWLADFASSSRGWRSPFAPVTRLPRRDHHEIELVNVDDGGMASVDAGATVDLHLGVLPARHGELTAAIVWTQPTPGGLTTLRFLTVQDAHRRDGGSSGVSFTAPITGRIKPRSVRVRGLRVTFIEDGRVRSIRLTASDVRRPRAGSAPTRATAAR